MVQLRHHGRFPETSLTPSTGNMSGQFFKLCLVFGSVTPTVLQVMATLHSALADPHGTPAQRRTAYRVMMGYILGLSDASLAENLSTIVVRGARLRVGHVLRAFLCHFEVYMEY